MIPPPTTQLTSVLKMLIEKDGVSERDTVYNGFRTRISELKLEYSLPIVTEKIPFVTALGRPSTYNKHSLMNKDKAEATKLYYRLIADKKGSVNPNKTYGKAGDIVEVIKSEGDLWAVDNDGEKFYVNKNMLEKVENANTSFEKIAKSASPGEQGLLF